LNIENEGNQYVQTKQCFDSEGQNFENIREEERDLKLL